MSSTLSIFAPAKLNLFLAITGRRSDGFHDLVSVVTTVDFGDTLHAELAAETTLTCDDPTLPVDESNLVLKAARAFVTATGWRGGVKFHLEKRVPAGAGLGGGSSDAVAALRALNTLAGGPLDAEKLRELAASLGSDCPLFLAGGPVVMRGRGERVELLSGAAAARLTGRRVLIFKPPFGISTPWAYGQMIARPETYLAGPDAEAQLTTWLADGQVSAEKLLFNNMERVAFAKWLALPALLEALERDFGVVARMSGSGSACFALLRENTPVDPLRQAIHAALGPAAFVREARLA